MRPVGKVRQVSNARTAQSAEVVWPATVPIQEIRQPGQADQQLTPHEMRLLKLLVEGHSYKTAAAKIGVSSHTVSFHLRRLYQKLNVHSKCEAVSKAFRDRLV